MGQRAALYCRVSTADQSCDRQERDLRALAKRSGFEIVRNIDLTSHLELRRPRDLLLAAAVAVGRPLRLTGYRWLSFVGGNALQAALAAGLIEYRFMVWHRKAVV